MTEALAMVRGAMGPQALIIQTRKIKQGGILGMLGSEAVEVVAGADEPNLKPASPAPQTETPQHQIADRQQHSTFKQIYDLLLEQGVLPELARSLVEEALCKYPSSAFAQNFPNFADRLYSIAGDEAIGALGKAVAKFACFEKSSKPASGPKVIGLVGPTGVGKTTTIAKLATIAAMRHKLPTGLITIDTYRIGAIDQLRTYSEMLGTPIEVVNRPEQMKHAIEHLSDRAVVFVDTIGRSPKDRDRVGELKPFFQQTPEAELHLVVSCTSKYGDAALAAKSFSALPLKRLIFSKVDESSSFGSVYNIAVNTRLPLSYLTTGQEVPDDIEVTTPARVAQLLAGAAA